MKFEYSAVLKAFLARVPLLVSHAVYSGLFGGQHLSSVFFREDHARPGTRISIFNDGPSKMQIQLARSGSSDKFGDGKKLNDTGLSMWIE